MLKPNSDAGWSRLENESGFLGSRARIDAGSDLIGAQQWQKEDAAARGGDRVGDGVVTAEGRWQALDF